jgi:Flp pilus assembly protein TadD
MALDENNVDAYGSLAAIYLAQKRLPEARQRFEELARKQSRPASTETMIGTILLQENKPEEARKHFERAIQLDPRAAVAANNLAWDYANGGGNLDVALQLAQTAKAELPNEGAITDTLGWIYYKKGLNSLAVSTLREAVQQSPSNPKIHYRLGLAYLKNGNEAEARATLQHALTLKPTAADAEEVKKALATITS